MQGRMLLRDQLSHPPIFLCNNPFNYPLFLVIITRLTNKFIFYKIRNRIAPNAHDVTFTLDIG